MPKSRPRPKGFLPVAVACGLGFLTTACLSGSDDPATSGAGVKVRGLDGVTATVASCNQGVLTLEVANSGAEDADAQVFLGAKDSSAETQFTAWDVTVPPGEWLLYLRAGWENNTTLSLKLDCKSPEISQVSEAWRESFSVDDADVKLAVLCADTLRLVADVKSLGVNDSERLEAADVVSRLASLRARPSGKIQADNVLRVLADRLAYHLDQAPGESNPSQSLAAIDMVDWLPEVCRYDAKLEPAEARTEWCAVRGKCDR